MAGPLATVYEVWQNGALPSDGGKLGNVQSPLWIVAICAAGLVVGLATFGHYVMRSMGTALAKLSPTRGFCAELATALVILVASQLGLPTSSSQVRGREGEQEREADTASGVRREDDSSFCFAGGGTEAGEAGRFFSSFSIAARNCRKTTNHHPFPPPPFSFPQCIIGAIVGVGLMEGIRAGVNWRLFGAQFASWVVTMFVCAGVTAALFAQGVYTPSKIDGAQVAAYQKGLMTMTNTTATAFNKTLYSYQDAAAAGAIPGLDQAQFDAYAKSTASVNKQLKTWKNATQPQSTAIKPADVFKTFKTATGLTANNTVDTLGQTTVFPGAELCNGPSLADIQANTRVECRAPTW